MAIENNMKKNNGEAEDLVIIDYYNRAANPEIADIVAKINSIGPVWNIPRDSDVIIASSDL